MTDTAVNKLERELSEAQAREKTPQKNVAQATEQARALGDRVNALESLRESVVYIVTAHSATVIPDAVLLEQLKADYAELSARRDTGGTPDPEASVSHELQRELTRVLAGEEEKVVLGRTKLVELAEMLRADHNNYRAALEEASLILGMPGAPRLIDVPSFVAGLKNERDGFEADLVTAQEAFREFVGAKATKDDLVVDVGVDALDVLERTSKTIDKLVGAVADQARALAGRVS